MKRRIYRSCLLLLVLAAAGCSDTAYSGAHDITNAADSFLIWGRMPTIDSAWATNPAGLFNSALDPTQWGGQPVQNGW